MRLLDRYLLRELLVPFGYCLGGFLIFWISSDVLVSLEDFQRHRLGGRDILEYYLVKAPGDVVFVLPIALLLALLYTLTNLARHQELTAMRAAGISLPRLALPFLIVGFLLSVASFAANEFWVPESMERAEHIFRRHNANPAEAGSRQWVRKLGFINLRDQRQWLIEAYNTVSGDMIRPHVAWPLPEGRRCELTAAAAARVDGVWIFTNAQQFTYSAVAGEYPAKEEFATVARPDFTETPEEIQSEIKIGRINPVNLKSVRKAELSLREILNYQRLHPETTGRLALMLATKGHGRMAAPWTCLVVVLIALPFGAMAGRRNVVVGVASSLVICFAFFVLRELTLALGTGGYVTPWLAAWAPNLSFAGLGLWLTWRAR